MPPKAGRGRGENKLAGKYKTQKRKAEETEDLGIQEDSSESPTRERRGRKSKKDVSPCTSKTPERSPEGSRSPHGLKSLLSSLKGLLSSPKSLGRIHLLPPPPHNRQPESSNYEGKYL